MNKNEYLKTRAANKQLHPNYGRGNPRRNAAHRLGAQIYQASWNLIREIDSQLNEARAEIRNRFESQEETN